MLGFFHLLFPSSHTPPGIGSMFSDKEKKKIKEPGEGSQRNRKSLRFMHPNEETLGCGITEVKSCLGLRDAESLGNLHK